MSFSFNTGQNPENSPENRAPKRNNGWTSSSSNPKSGLIAGSITAIVGLLIMIFGFWASHEDKQLIDSGVRVEGVISNIEYDTRLSTTNNSSKKNVSKTTTVTFTAEDGKRYSTAYSKKQSSTFDQRRSLQEDIGKKEIVFYEATNPNKSVVKGQEVNLFNVIFGGGIALIVGSVIVVSSRSALKKKSEDQD